MLGDQATQYGPLVIALTFVGVGLVEVMRPLRVHPVHYLLVGSALATFFLPLVSLTQSLLVRGSLLRFAVLAGVTVATRRVDWYTLFKSLHCDPAPATAMAPQ